MLVVVVFFFSFNHPFGTLDNKFYSVDMFVLSSNTICVSVLMCAFRFKSTKIKCFLQLQRLMGTNAIAMQSPVCLPVQLLLFMM